MSAQTVTVTRGIAYLDEHLPGWQDEINWSELEMDSCEKCILGQLFGDYKRGLHILRIPESRALRFGFNTRGDWHKLTNIWKRLAAPA
jgi:hypothetical protein